MKVTTYFEISEKAEMAYDIDTDEPTTAYSAVSTEYRKNLSDEEIQTIHQFHLATICRQFGWPAEYLRQISEEEYRDETEDGDAE